MPAYYPEGNAPLREDYTERSLQKINSLLVGALPPEWDRIGDFSYDGNNNLTTLSYYLGGAKVQTLTLTYDGSNNITGIAKS